MKMAPLKVRIKNFPFFRDASSILKQRFARKSVLVLGTCNEICSNKCNADI